VVPDYRQLPDDLRDALRRNGHERRHKVRVTAPVGNESGQFLEQLRYLPRLVDQNAEVQDRRGRGGPRWTSSNSATASPSPAAQAFDAA
jgi:hypothetical protein